MTSSAERTRRYRMRMRTAGPSPDDLSVTGADIPRAGEWRANARCRTAPPNLFFPVRGDDPAPAKAICKGCPALDDCRSYALANPDLSGVWGGLSESERSDLRSVDRPPPQPGHPAAANAPKRAYAGALYKTLQELAAHPDRWAIVKRYPGRPGRGSASAMASMLRNGQRNTPPGRWSFEGRVDDGKGAGSTLYARFDGHDNDEVAS